MKTPQLSESDAQKLERERRELLAVGWRDGRTLGTRDDQSKRGNDMIVMRVGVPDAGGNQREIPVYLVASRPVILRHACEACGCLPQYGAGHLTASDFPVGHPVRVKIGIEKKSRSVPFDRNVIEDFAVAESSVVNLRATS